MRLIYLIFISSFTLHSVFGQDTIIVEEIATGFSIPIDIKNDGISDDLYIVEKMGAIYRLDENGDRHLFLNIANKIRTSGNEQGLLGLAFHPSFATNGYFYVNYSRASDGDTHVSRFSVKAGNPKEANPNSEKIILYVDQTAGNHNGGHLAFGPDGYLYIGLGDGGGANDLRNNAQNRNLFLGKMLRIDVDQGDPYLVPADNPFVNDPNTRDEIWSIGLRNPWRYSFDRQTGDLWMGDVGQNKWEEIDFQPASSAGGENYGWRCYEGHHDFNLQNCSNRGDYTFPIWEYSNSGSGPSSPGCSVTGGYVYRGMDYPALYGAYIFGDYCSGRIWKLRVDEMGQLDHKEVFSFRQSGLASFGEDRRGELYACRGNGRIYRIKGSCELPQIDVQIKNPSCPGTSDGEIILIPEFNDFLEINWAHGASGDTLTQLGEGDYKYYISRGVDCMDSMTVSLVAPEQKKACILPVSRTEFCASDTVLLIACDTPAAVHYRWYLNGQLITQPGKWIPARLSGYYQLEIVDSAGCASDLSDSIDILIHANPAKPLIEVRGDSLIGPDNYISYEWFKDGQFFASTTVPYLLLQMSGDYHLVVINDHNCRSDSSNTVQWISSKTHDPYSDELEVLIYSSGGKILVQLNDPSVQFIGMRIDDLYGKNVYSDEEMWRNNRRIASLNLPAGIYSLRLVDENKEVHGRMFFIAE